MEPVSNQIDGDLSPPIVQQAKKLRNSVPVYDAAYLEEQRKAQRLVNKQKKEDEQILANMKEKKRLESLARKENMSEVMNDLTVNKLSIAAVRKKYESFNYQPGVLRRNLKSVEAGNGLAHKGPARMFESSDVMAMREREIKKGLHKNSTNRNDAQAVLNSYRREISFQRAEDAFGDRELVQGRRLQDMSVASFYRYKKPVLGDTIKAYSQNAARSEALSCIYNALSLVAVARAMNGYLFDTSRSGVGQTDALFPRDPACFINIDGSCSYLGNDGQKVVVCAPTEVKELLNEKNLSVGSTVNANAPSIQRRSVKYNFAVNGIGSPLAFVIYIKDSVFPSLRCDLVCLGEDGTITFYMFLLGSGSGVDDHAARRLLADIVNPLLRAAEHRSKAESSGTFMVDPTAPITTSSAGAAGAAAGSSSYSSAAATADDEDVGEAEDVADHSGVESDDDAPQPRRNRQHGQAESSVPINANPLTYHRAVLFMDGEQEQIRNVLNESVKLDGDLVKTAARSTLVTQTLDVIPTFQIVHTYLNGPRMQQLLEKTDTEVQENWLMRSAKQHLACLEPASRRIYTRFLAMVPDIVQDSLQGKYIRKGWEDIGLVPFSQEKLLSTCATWNEYTFKQQGQIMARMPDLVHAVVQKGFVTDGEIQTVMGDLVGVPLRGSDPHLYDGAGQYQHELPSVLEPAPPRVVVPPQHVAHTSLQDLPFNRGRVFFGTEQHLRGIIQTHAEKQQEKAEQKRLRDQRKEEKQAVINACRSAGLKGPYTPSNVKKNVSQCCNPECLSDLGEAAGGAAKRCNFCTGRWFCASPECQLLLGRHQTICREKNAHLATSRQSEADARNAAILAQATTTAMASTSTSARSVTTSTRQTTSTSSSSSSTTSVFANSPGVSRNTLAAAVTTTRATLPQVVTPMRSVQEATTTQPTTTTLPAVTTASSTTGRRVSKSVRRLNI